jgi:putative DNA methylase
MTHPVRSPRKLIEVALPLDAINVAAAREKSIRHGHPSTLHLWWARRPLAAARAVLFAQLVNDPGYQQGGGFKYGKNKREAAAERKRLFGIIERLVQWENTTNEAVLEEARAEIRRSWREVCELNKDHPQAAELFDPEKLPAFHDPFAGGGSIPLEAQRLGLEAYASDLNPVAVLINKAMIEIPPKFAGRPPVGPEPEAPAKKGRAKQMSLTEREWPGASGLAEDVRRYGAWMRDEAQKRIGHLYPPVEITTEMAKDRPDLEPLVGQKLTVIAWIWARTVKSPNPAFSHVDVPLASTFVLSSKKGKEAYVQPIVNGDSYRFSVKVCAPKHANAAKNGTKLSRGANFQCLLSGTAISGEYIKAEGMAGRLGDRLMAIVVEGARGRIYLAPTQEHELIVREAKPTWAPEQEIAYDPHSGATACVLYGLRRFGDLFTSRQLVAMSTFSDLVQEVCKRAKRAALAAHMPDDGKRLTDGGIGAEAYGDAVAVYVAFAVDKGANYWSSICAWSTSTEKMVSTFSRQALPMVWDYTEANPFSASSGNWDLGIEQSAKMLLGLGFWYHGVGMQAAAQKQDITAAKVVSTDPPYFDNVPYADLSDFFYAWLRRSLKTVFHELFSTISVPKEEELVAFVYRHNNKATAEAFFLDGMTQAMHRLAELAQPAFPVSIYYAFRQADTSNEDGTISTGWVTFLEAVLRAGFVLTGTWPVRTEYTGNLKVARNALASSVVLVCRKRLPDASIISRREFQRELNAVLPEALDEMTRGAGEDRSPVAPVDLSQAIIGPGMAVFSKYSAVLEADGSPMSVRTALQLINRFLAEDDFEADTQLCLHWFEQHGWDAGRFGDADTLSRAKGTSVDGLREAGVLEAGGGSVRLLRWSEYPAGWDPRQDARKPVWETLHHLIRALKHDGESGAGRLLGAVRAQAEAARQLAYRLYTLCERNGRAEDARAYNELITSWTAIEATVAQPAPGELFQP